MVISAMLSRFVFRLFREFGLYIQLVQGMYFDVAALTIRNSVVHIMSQFRIVFIGQNMMRAKVSTSAVTASLAGVAIPLKYRFPPSSIFSAGHVKLSLNGFSTLPVRVLFTLHHIGLPVISAFSGTKSHFFF